MDYIGGQDPRSLPGEQASSCRREATAVTVKVSQVLEVAHTQGVVHRDLKPQNIMIDSQGRAMAYWVVP